MMPKRPRSPDLVEALCDAIGPLTAPPKDVEATHQPNGERGSMFLFVLEFLFYAALILGGLVLLLNILASDQFWNAIAAVLLIGVCGAAA
jgi:hypothetical protein